MFRRPLVLALLLSLAAPVHAYEGAGEHREEPEPPKAPQLTKPPALASQVEAAYPDSLLQLGVGGDVVLVVDIAADGTVPKAEVKQSSGHPELDESARQALLQFTFTPAELDGKPALVRLEYLYRFEPRPPPPPPPEAPPAPKPVNLKGLVLERGTREPLADATVFLPESGLVVQSDDEGRFEIRGAPVGKVKVEVTESKHRRYETTVDVVEGEETTLTAYLWRRIENGFEVTVRGEREKKEVSRRTLQQEELRSVPGTFGDPIRVLQNLPGMARAPYVAGALLVRGAQPEDTGAYIDGLRIPLLYHFAGGPSVVSPSFIERIDFFPGAYGAKYGRAIAGIVDVASKPPTPKSLHGSFDVDVLDAGFFLEGPVKKGDPSFGTWAVAARRSYVDVFLPTLLDYARRPGEASVVAAPRYWDYQARYDVDVGANHLALVAFGSDDTLDVAQAGTADTQGFSVNSHQGFHRLRAEWSRALAGWQLRVAPALGTDANSFDLDDTISVDLGTTTFHTRASARKELLKSLSFEAGFDYNWNRFDVDLNIPEFPEYQTFPGENPELGTVRRTFERSGQAQALYAEAVWNPWGGLKLVPGLRVEHYMLPAKNHLSIEPRLAGRYEFSDAMAVKLAWGRFRQNPRPEDLDEELGNPDLGLEESSQWVAGFERRLLPKLTLDLQLFYNSRTALVTGNKREAIQKGEPRLVNGGLGHAYGLELLLKQDLTERMYGWIAYTLSRSEQQNYRTGEWAPVEFDQTHILTVVGSYKFDGGWETGLRMRLTTGRPDAPVLGSTFDADTLGYRSIRGERGSIRGATFHQLDFRVEKQWTYEQWRLSSYLDVQNIYNAENPEGIIWDYRYRQNAPIRGLPFLPTVGVTGSF